MSNRRKIFVLWFCGILLVSCKTFDIPQAYDFKSSEIKENPYGCWIKVIPDSIKALHKLNPFAGELICIENDSLYILENDYMVSSVSASDILRAELYTHKNQGKTYARLTAAFLIPNFLGALIYTSEYGGGFFGLGIPVALIGLTTAIIEGNSSRSILNYPQGATIDRLKLFARFPAGKPSDVDFSQLRLKRP